MVQVVSLWLSTQGCWWKNREQGRWWWWWRNCCRDATNPWLKGRSAGIDVSHITQFHFRHFILNNCDYYYYNKDLFKTFFSFLFINRPVDEYRINQWLKKHSVSPQMSRGLWGPPHPANIILYSRRIIVVLAVKQVKDKWIFFTQTKN